MRLPRQRRSSPASGSGRIAAAEERTAEPPMLCIVLQKRKQAPGQCLRRKRKSTSAARLSKPQDSGTVRSGAPAGAWLSLQGLRVFDFGLPSYRERIIIGDRERIFTSRPCGFSMGRSRARGGAVTLAKGPHPSCLSAQIAATHCRHQDLRSCQRQCVVRDAFDIGAARDGP